MIDSLTARSCKIDLKLKGNNKHFLTKVLERRGWVIYNVFSTQYKVRWLGKVQVKGRQDAFSVFEVSDGAPEEIAAVKMKTREDFERGLTYYNDNKSAEASVCFNNVLKSDPEDKAARLYLERTAHFKANRAPSHRPPT